MSRAHFTFPARWLVGGLCLAWLPAPAAESVLEPPVNAKPVLLPPVISRATVLGSIEVNFTMDRPEYEDPAARIVWATVTDVVPGSTARTAGFRPGDAIIRVNEQLVRGLTLREFFVLVVKDRQRGDLVWKLRRGILGEDHFIVFNGKVPAKRP